MDRYRRWRWSPLATGIVWWIIAMLVAAYFIYWGPGAKPSPCYGSWC
jgi:hypothetical protein